MKIDNQPQRNAVESRPRVTPWDQAVSARDFLGGDPQEDLQWIATDIVARGLVTMAASPRGLGKSLVADALAVAVATGGTFRGMLVKKGRVLLVDRDNPPNLVRQRLRSFGWDAAGDNLKLLTRDIAPPLTDVEAWSAFPFESYDVVILDSFGAFTEGIAEGNTRANSKAMALLADIARRGPALLILSNTRRDASAIRGPGGIVDRLDIMYEVRDATDLEVDPTKAAWWECLRKGDDRQWSTRARIRQQREVYRLAFVPSKFRVGPEPEPWALELRLGDEPDIVDVTAELRQAYEEATGLSAAQKIEMLNNGARILFEAVTERDRQRDLIGKTEAEELLTTRAGLSRLDARNLIAQQEGRLWVIVPREERTGGRRGSVLVRIVSPEEGTAESLELQQPLDSKVPDTQLSADTAGQGQQKVTAPEPLPGNGSGEATPISPVENAATKQQRGHRGDRDREPARARS